MTLILPVSFDENISSKIENEKIQYGGGSNHLRAPNTKFAGGGGPPYKILPDGQIVSDEYRKSYWYCFITSLDREKDVTLLKEIVFWERIYHKNTSQVEVLVPDNDRYYFYSRLFQVYEVPCLVLTDSDTYPLDYVVIPKNIISEEYLGERYIKFRELLDFFHNIVMIDGKLSKVKKELIKQKVESILEKSSSVLKEIVINIGGRAI